MVGAVVGVAVYLLADTNTPGIIIILASMVFKMIESLLRFYSLNEETYFLICAFCARG